MTTLSVLTRCFRATHDALAKMSKENVVRINTAAVIFALTAAAGVLIDRAITATKLGRIEEQLTVLQTFHSRIDRLEVKLENVERDVDRVVKYVPRP